MAEQIGHGSKVAIGTTTDVLGLTSVDFGSNKIDTLDKTNMRTPGTVRTYTAGLEDPGDVTLKFNVIPGDSSQAALYTYKGKEETVVVTYPGAVRIITFQAIVTSVDESIPDDKLPTITAKLKVSGDKTNSTGNSGS